MLHHCTLLTVLLCWAPSDVLGTEEEVGCQVGDKTYQTDEKWQIEGKCLEATCQGSMGYTMLGCPLLRLDEGEGWSLTPEDLQKDYPDCCPQCVPPPTPVNPGKPCVDEDVEYEAGQQRHDPTRCELNLCMGDNVWAQAACGLVGLQPGWTLSPEDLTKLFPDCCPKAVPPIE